MKDPEVMSPAFVKFAVYVMACLFAGQQRIHERLDAFMESGGSVPGGNLHDVLIELQNRLEDSWTMTQEQIVSIQ